MYDVIIIGAGFTGLLAGSLLVKDGYKVAIFERNSFVGGRAATRTPKEWGWADREDYLIDFGHHIFATNNYLEFILDRVGAKKYFKFVPLKMPYFYKNGKLHKPPVGIIEQIRAYPWISFGSKLKLRKFLSYVKKVSFKEVIEKWAYRPLNDLYDEFGFDENARELFTDGFVAGYQTITDTNRNSAGDLILCMKAYLKGIKKYKTPVFSAEGGVGKIAEALHRVITESGGEVHLEKNVQKIIVENGEAKGVMVDDKVIEAKKILLAAPVYYLLDLIEEEKMPEDFKKRLEEGKKEATKLFLILGGAKKPLRDIPTETWILVPRSEVKKVESYYLIYEVSPELKQAPEGRYVLSIAVLPKEEDLRDKDALAKRMIEDMSNLFPNFDFENDWDWRNEVLFPIVDGIGRTIDWYWEKRLGPETPIKNLYVAGDSAQELSSGVDGCASSAIFAVEAITGKKLINSEEFYKI
ncbi:MAG: phytoene desaturase family protein [Candidatus Njordarchaeales archaeon]